MSALAWRQYVIVAIGLLGEQTAIWHQLCAEPGQPEVLHKDEPLSVVMRALWASDTRTVFVSKFFKDSFYSFVQTVTDKRKMANRAEAINPFLFCISFLF